MNGPVASERDGMATRPHHVIVTVGWGDRCNQGTEIDGYSSVHASSTDDTTRMMASHGPETDDILGRQDHSLLRRSCSVKSCEMATYFNSP